MESSSLFSEQANQFMNARFVQLATAVGEGSVFSVVVAEKKLHPNNVIPV